MIMTTKVPIIKKYQKWKVGQINIRSCSDELKLDFALRECLRANLDVICFQEVRMLNSGSVKLQGYNFYWKGLQRIRDHGVGIAIRDSPSININAIESTNERMMAADITVSGCKLRIISCYAPTLFYASTTKETFYKSLSKLCKTERNRKVLIQGDFNCELDCCRRISYFDGSKGIPDWGINMENENAQLFTEFCCTNNLSILNSWFEHPIHHRVTWHHPGGNSKKVYDYSLTQPWLRQFIHDVRVRNSYFNSDHRLVVTILHTPVNKAARSFKRPCKVLKHNLSLLKNENIHNLASENINTFLSQNFLQLENINDLHQHLVTALEKGKAAIPRQTKIKQIIPWQLDDELTNLHLKRLKLRKLPPTNNNKTIIKNVSKAIKQRVKHIQNCILKDKAKELNEAKQHKQLTKLWKTAKNHDNVIKAKPIAIQCQGLKNHFKNHFNPDHSDLVTPLEILNPPEYIQALKDASLDITESPPTEEEICLAVKQLNDGKASLDAEPEILKLALSIPSYIDLLKHYFQLIWTEDQIPKQWRVSKITPIWKQKGSALDPSNYRGISNGSIFCKVGMNIILKRMSTFYEHQLKNTQFGFRSGSGCNDGIYMLKQLHEIAVASDRKLFACFIDLTAAFDHINRKLLFKTIKNRLAAAHNTNITLIENLYSSTSSYLCNDNPTVNSFSTSSGVRQGGNEGPPLFNFYGDYCIRVYENRRREEGITGLGIPFCIPSEATNRSQREKSPTHGTCDDAEECYADDLVLFAWTVEDLQTCVQVLASVYTEFGLTINETKTETVIFNYSKNEQYPETIIKLNGQPLKNSCAIKYLGVWVNYSDLGIGKEEINHRICAAHNAFAQNRKLLTNHYIKLETRIMLLNSLVRSRLTYGCHAWRPTTTEIGKIDTIYRSFLRKMIFRGYERVNPPPAPSSGSSSEEDQFDDEEYDWRYVINNERLLNITGTQDISCFYHLQQQNWIAHTIRRDNDNPCKRLTFYDICRKKLGRKSPSILDRTIQYSGMSREQFLRTCFLKKNSQR